MKQLTELATPFASVDTTLGNDVQWLKAQR